jgi:DNA-binding XRE family transcriptional regulator
MNMVYVTPPTKESLKENSAPMTEFVMAPIETAPTSGTASIELNFTSCPEVKLNDWIINQDQRKKNAECWDMLSKKLFAFSSPRIAMEIISQAKSSSLQIWGNEDLAGAIRFSNNDTLPLEPTEIFKRGTPVTEVKKRLAKFFKNKNFGADGLKQLALLSGHTGLKKFRMEAGITQIQLAKKIGAQQYQISNAEKNADNVTFSTLEKIRKALKLDTATFYEGIRDT